MPDIVAHLERIADAEADNAKRAPNQLRRQMILARARNIQEAADLIVTLRARIMHLDNEKLQARERLGK